METKYDHYIVPTIPAFAYFYDKSEEELVCLPIVCYGCYYSEAGVNVQEALIMDDSGMSVVDDCDNFLGSSYDEELYEDDFYEEISAFIARTAGEEEPSFEDFFPRFFAAATTGGK